MTMYLTQFNPLPAIRRNAFAKMIALAVLMAGLLSVAVLQQVFATPAAVAVRQVPDQLSEWLTTLVQLITLALPLIGVTGGLQGLLDGIPDLTIWKWTVKGGVIAVAVVAVLGVIASNLLGWVQPPSSYPDPQSWLYAQYTLIAATMMIIYSLAGLRVKPTAPVPVDVKVVATS